MSLDDTLHVAGLVEDSIVDGDGFRFTIFVQGCKRCCPNCQNPETQPLEGGHEETLEALLQKIRQNPLLTGVTFSGGDISRLVGATVCSIFSVVSLPA